MIIAPDVIREFNVLEDDRIKSTHEIAKIS